MHSVYIDINLLHYKQGKKGGGEDVIFTIALLLIITLAIAFTMQHPLAMVRALYRKSPWVAVPVVTLTAIPIVIAIVRDRRRRH